jgi:hypothetical protein
LRHAKSPVPPKITKSKLMNHLLPNVYVTKNKKIRVFNVT